ncbi:MAG: aldose 1-epimerase [Solirubrobacterales bacterium]|nr:aldose 1-epimerase [Solirubrobacterales bacterium]
MPTITSAGGETAAEFAPEANMVCASLRHRGAELLDLGRGLQAYAQQGKTMGIPLLYPWANRLAEPAYAAAGRSVTLPEAAGRYSLDPNGLPIHGALPEALRWRAEADGDRIVARLAWEGDDLLALFPYAHELAYEASVACGELTVTITLRATGSDEVPVAFGFHPYLTLPGSRRQEWRVSLGATQRLLLDERMIPTGAREPLAPRELVLGDQSWDDGLDGLAAPPRFSVAALGIGLELTFLEGFGFAQVYAPPGHDYICFEPMTAPTNALRSGDGLTVVAPGAEHRAGFRLRVLA